MLDPKTHLSLRDVSFDSSGKVWSFVLTIKASKTDQFRKGAHVALGATSSDLCPVAALLDYLARRGRTPGPLFQLEDGKLLKRWTFATSVQQALTIVVAEMEGNSTVTVFELEPPQLLVLPV